MKMYIDADKGVLDYVNINIFAKLNSFTTVRLLVDDLIAFGFKRVTVYSPDTEVSVFRCNLPASCMCCKDTDIDESSRFLNVLRNKYTHGLIKSVGWYYQQYLKMQSVAKSNGLVVIIDGDTYISPLFLYNQIINKNLSATKEDVSKYNEFLNIALPAIDLDRSSYIANYGIISSEQFRSYIESVELIFEMLFKSRRSGNVDSDLSEYQIFGNIMFNFGWNVRKLKIFRRADLLLNDLVDVKSAVSMCKARGYNVIALEINHNRTFKLVMLAFAALLLGHSW